MAEKYSFKNHARRSLGYAMLELLMLPMVTKTRAMDVILIVASSFHESTSLLHYEYPIGKSLFG